jgi:hypothetical protein
MPERVVAVTKRRRKISGRGCLAIATTRSGLFFSLIERFHCLSVTYILRADGKCLKFKWPQDRKC